MRARREGGEGLQWGLAPEIGPERVCLAYLFCSPACTLQQHKLDPPLPEFHAAGCGEMLAVWEGGAPASIDIRTTAPPGSETHDRCYLAFPRPAPPRQDRRDDKSTKKWLYEGMVVKFVARAARHASVLDLAMQLQTNVRVCMYKIQTQLSVFFVLVWRDTE